MTITIQFTEDQVHTILGALNAAAIRRTQQAKRARRNPAKAAAWEQLADDYMKMFALIVDTRTAAAVNPPTEATR